MSEISNRIDDAKAKQSYYYNRKAKEKATLPQGQTVRVKLRDNTEWIKAEVDKVLPHRSYIVRTEDGSKYRRNSKHVRFSEESPIILEETAPEEVAEDPANIPRQPQIELKQQSITTRSGRIVKKPMRYRDN